HRVQMGRRAVPRLAPLLEQAELRTAVLSRDAHPRQHALAPLLARRAVEIDDAHGIPPIADRDTLANDGGGHNRGGTDVRSTACRAASRRDRRYRHSVLAHG